MKQTITCVTIAFFMLTLYGCNYFDEPREDIFSQIPEIKEIKPEKPVKIKLKRNISGNYTWEIQGSDVERVIDTNNRLRTSLSGEI